MTNIPPSTYVFLISDIATVVGYLVVSRPFMNLAHKPFLNLSHSEIMMVSVSRWYVYEKGDLH